MFTTGRYGLVGSTPTQAQIIAIAHDVISTLRSVKVDACFVGGMGCYLQGGSRKPNDLDVLCLTAIWDQEALKKRLTVVNGRFDLVDSRKINATYKVLWYNTMAPTYDCLKIDLLFPGVLDIPSIPPSIIEHSNVHQLPCAPLSLNLLLKLQAWVHHGESTYYRYKSKQPVDARDINELLPIACRRKLLPRTESSFPESFISLGESRVKKYVKAFPETKGWWTDLGFEIPVEVTPKPDHLLMHRRRAYR